MANEQLTIQKNDARLKVIGNSYPDSMTNSGEGLDIPQIIIDILTDLDIDLPDIDPDDWDNLPIVIGLDEDDVPVIEFPDPDFDPDLHPDELPDIIDWPLPDLDWEDLIDGLEDLDIDPGILTDLNFTGLDADGLPSLVNIDTDFKVYVDDLPASIAVVFPPNKTSYTQGQVIDITGLYVYAYKADGTVWRGSERIGDRYRSGRVPNDELIIEPKVAKLSDEDDYDFSAVGMLPKGDVVISTNNGNRTPVVKHGNGAAAGFVSYHIHSPDDWGGGWIGAGIITTGNASITGGHPGSNSAIVDGKHVTLIYMSTNKDWGGGTALTNPLGLPAVGPLCAVNSVPTPEMIASVAHSLGFQPKEADDHMVNVIWNRPGDGRPLMSFFEITIRESGGGGR